MILHACIKTLLFNETFQLTLDHGVFGIAAKDLARCKTLFRKKQSCFLVILILVILVNSLLFYLK